MGTTSVVPISPIKSWGFSHFWEWYRPNSMGRVAFLSRKSHTERNFSDHRIPENALAPAACFQRIPHDVGVFRKLFRPRGIFICAYQLVHNSEARQLGLFSSLESLRRVIQGLGQHHELLSS